MRKLFQKEWHGIPFKDFVVTSSSCLPDLQFYKSFYSCFLSKYHDWGDLDPEWVKLKLETAGLLESQFKAEKNTKILSLSCGLGVIEKELVRKGYSNLSITETLIEPLAWIRKYVPQENIFIGFFPDCLPKNYTYDIIYLAGAEYFLDQDELILLLKEAKSRLSDGGRCILVSWSFEPATFLNKMMSIAKYFLKYFFQVLHIKDRGQFWGYSRNQSDFHNAFVEAGFNIKEDGVLKKDTQWDTYWISAKIKKGI